MAKRLVEAVIIIVEDNENNMLIAMKLLRDKVRYINARPSGKQMFQLVESLDRRNVDLILLDLQIPLENGYAVLEKIRVHPQLQNTIVAALTANVSPADVDKARAAGFDGFIGKPIDFDRFSDQVARILAGESVWEPL